MGFDILRNLDQRSQINLLIFALIQGLEKGSFQINTSGGGGGGGDASAANQLSQINLETAANILLADIESLLSGSSITFDSVADQNVTTAGTREQCANVPTPRGVILTAKQTNQGQIYVGGAGVAATGQQGMVLAATQKTPPLLVANLDQIFIDADNSGEGVGILIL